MTRKIEISLDEATETFMLLEDLVKFFHQPANYSQEAIEKFAIEQNGYKRIAHLYYDVVWNWLPDDVQKMIEDR